MKCNECKHCSILNDLLTQAYGGYVFKCDLKKGINGTVGHKDRFSPKPKFYLKTCGDFLKKGILK